MIPPNVREYFFPFDQNKEQPERLMYLPMIVGAAQVCFSEPKAKVNIAEEKVYLVPVSDNPMPVNWEEAKETKERIADLKYTPAKDATYADLPSAALNSKNYAVWAKDFENWLFRTQRIQLLKSAYLNELSKPGETDRDFRIRLQQLAREKRDQQVSKVREKYASSFTRLDERLRKAKMNLEEQKAQAQSQKYQVAVSIGETLLGSFLGRKSGTRATRSAREIARTRKESRDRETAEQNMKAIEQERAKLETRFQSEISSMENRTNPLAETLEEVSITPSKADITVRLVALVWTL
jgi:hypothetical protein